MSNEEFESAQVMKRLEIENQQFKDLIKSLSKHNDLLAENIQDIKARQDHYDRNFGELKNAVTQMSAAMSAHFKEAEKESATLTEIAKSVQGLREELPKIVLKIHKDSNEEIDKVFTRIRTVEKDLADFKINAVEEHALIEKNIKKDIFKVITTVLVILQIASGSLLTALYNNITDNIKENTLKTHVHKVP